jgi:uncharacterized phosphatase
VTTILLVRHGETDWNQERRVQGNTDRPLNETGRRQALELAEALAAEKLDAVYSSDLMRAHETARIVAERKGLDVVALPELRERDFGTWEGLTDEEILERFPHAHHGPWGDAESREEMFRRAQEALRRIASAYPDGRVLVVTHGGPARALLAGSGYDGVERIANCALHRLRLEGGVFTRVD